uniref:Rho-GAP domain-containing protein n=1 Tax=Parascaris equorum TaxID=6256 RepID=A0A914REB9_PAREQ
MPLSVVRSRSGLSLPRSILELMHFLSTNVADTVGIFRKNGVRSRIAELRAKCDVDPYEEVFPDSKGLDPLQVACFLQLQLTFLDEIVFAWSEISSRITISKYIILLAYFLNCGNEFRRFRIELVYC